MRNFENRPAIIRSAINHHPFTTTPDISVAKAIEMMKDTDSSCLLVLADGEPNSLLVGLFTQRDVVRLAASGVDWYNLSLASVMTTELITIKETEAQDILAVVRQFRQHRIRHLPVVEEEGNLIGLITHQSIRESIQPADLFKQKQVSEVMSSRVIYAFETTSILEVAQMMNKERVSCVVIVEQMTLNEGKITSPNIPQSAFVSNPQTLLFPVGIITERDIVQFCHLELDLDHILAEEVMSTPLLPIQQSDSLWTAHKIMQQHRVRRLVVSGDQGELAGIITPTRILEAIKPMEISQTLDTMQDLIDEQIHELKNLNQQLKKEIRQRKLVEDKLRTSEVKIRATFEAMTDVVLVLNTEADQIESIEILPTNSNYGCELEKDLINETIEKFFHDYRTAKTWLRKIRLALETKQKLNFDYSLSWEGRKLWFTASISPISENSVLWVARDISDRKQAEKSLRESEERFRAIFQQAAVGINQLSLNGEFIQVNSRFCEIVKYTKAELLQLTWEDITYRDDLEIYSNYVRQIFAGDICTFSMEKRLIDKNSQVKWVNVSITLVRDWEGIPQYLISVVEDISQRQIAEIALRESEERFCAIFDQAAVGISQVALSGNFLQVNPQFCQMVGYTQSELLQLTWQDITYTDDIQSVLNAVRQLLAGEIFTSSIEKRLACKSGELKWVNISISLVRDWQEIPQYFIVVVKDISERKKVETALQESEARERQKAQELEITLQQLKNTQSLIIQSEKMSSLACFVAGVAHEINNPTSFIYGNIQPATDYVQDLFNTVQLYQRHYPEPVPEIVEQLQKINLNFIAEDFPKLLASMKQGAERISNIVISLQNFSRLAQSKSKRVDIHEGIDNTLVLLQHRLKEQSNRPEIQVIKEYGQLPKVECFPDRINQVFMSILCNAIDAIEESLVISQKSLVKEKRQRTNDKGIIRICSYVIESRVVISIADNGFGISTEILPKIFDPFFTTKPPGKGTGLGLSLSYKIVVEGHGGQIRCDSVVGRGAEFVIELPIVQAKSQYLVNDIS